MKNDENIRSCSREKTLQKTLESHHVISGSLKRKLDEGNFQSINMDLHIPIFATLLS
jgi:hypothetical protein